MQAAYSNLEYQVAVYRMADAADVAAASATHPPGPATIGHPPLQPQPFIVPLTEAVPIGTRLQLRVSVNPDGGESPVSGTKQQQ